MIRPLSACLVTMVAALASTAGAAGLDDFHGRAKLEYKYSQAENGSIASALGDRSRHDGVGEFRLRWEPRWDSWNAGVHYLLDGTAGDTVGLNRRLDALRILPPAPAEPLLDLEHKLADGNRARAVHSIDRLFVGFAGNDVVGRMGRQVLTVGAGLVFRPMDLFNPFAPNASDVEYKRGTDMVYGQWLIDGATDIQAAVVPRRATSDDAFDRSQSSAAIIFRRTIGRYQAGLMAARDHGDTVVGVSANGPLGDATWNIETVPTFTDDSVRLSFLANLSSAWVVGGKDITGYAEYFRNGFGRNGDGYSLASLPGHLIDRLSRGQLFNTGRHYLALGARIQWSALLQIDPLLILNLGDRSALARIDAVYSLSDDLSLVIGGQLPIGRSGTEYGGIALSPLNPATVAPSAEIYAQLRFYF